MVSADRAWADCLQEILRHGIPRAPRGLETLEIPHRTLVMDMSLPVVTNKERKLSYQFMAAEAYWIMTGDNRVSTIAPYNKNISAFSDDGEVFFGAYGPPIKDQLPYVLKSLAADQETRQAGLTIWRPSPLPSKDIPCTVAIWFRRIHHNLTVHVFMRSSDAWLGVPYDIFNFSMLGHLVCAKLNEMNRGEECISPSTLYVTMVSSHLYLKNADDARRCLAHIPTLNTAPTPTDLFRSSVTLETWLKSLRESRHGSPLRWWEEGDIWWN